MLKYKPYDLVGYSLFNFIEKYDQTNSKKTYQEMVHILNEKPQRAIYQNIDGHTYFQHLILLHKPELLKKILHTFPDHIFPLDSKARTSIHYAVLSEDLETLALLLEKAPCYIDAQDELGRTALHLASMTDNHQMVELLLKHNANYNILDSQGNTALYYALIDSVKKTYLNFILICPELRDHFGFKFKKALPIQPDAGNTDISVLMNKLKLHSESFDLYIHDLPYLYDLSLLPKSPTQETIVFDEEFKDLSFVFDLEDNILSNKKNIIDYIFGLLYSTNQEKIIHFLKTIYPHCNFKQKLSSALALKEILILDIYNTEKTLNFKSDLSEYLDLLKADGLVQLKDLLTAIVENKSKFFQNPSIDNYTINQMEDKISVESLDSVQKINSKLTSILCDDIKMMSIMSYSTLTPQDFFLDKTSLKLKEQQKIFNTLSYWIIESILNTDNEASLLNQLELWVNVATKLLISKHNIGPDLNGFQLVVSAINTGALSRLFPLLKLTNPDLIIEIERLNSMCLQRNFIQLRELANSSDISIPALSIFSKDFTFSLDGNQGIDKIAAFGNMAYKFILSQRHLMYKKIYFQSDLLSIIESRFTFNLNSMEDSFYRVSYKIKPLSDNKIDKLSHKVDTLKIKKENSSKKLALEIRSARTIDHRKKELSSRRAKSEDADSYSVDEKDIIKKTNPLYYKYSTLKQEASESESVQSANSAPVIIMRK